jgi:hypothetical protein
LYLEDEVVELMPPAPKASHRRRKLTRGNLINTHNDGLGFSGRRALVNSKTGQPNKVAHEK